jgi:hypothetical protein
MAKTSKVPSNTETQKTALFAECKALGDNHKKGTTAIAELMRLCAVYASDKLIVEQHCAAILQSFLDGSGPMGDKTVAKMKSQILVMIRAGALPKVEFIKTLDKAAKMHAEKAKTKNKPAQLTELYLGLARTAIKNDGRAISEAQIKEKLQAPASRESNKDKAAPVVRMIRAVRKLSIAEARQLLAVVKDRLGIDEHDEADVGTEADDNPIEAMIAAAGKGGLLMREAGSTLRDAPVARLLETKKRRK